MKLLALDLGAAMRGGQRQTALLAAGLAARGHDVRLLARRGAPLAEAARSSGVAVREVSAGGDASPFLLLAVAREARVFRPDVVYAGDARGHGAAVFGRAAAAAPLVVHRRVAFPPGRSPFSRVKYAAAARYLAVSAAVAASLEAAGIPRARIAVVPDGLPETAFRESAAPAGPPWRLVHAGAFDGLKGQDVAVDVLGRLVAAGVDATLLFLGAGPARPSVEARAAAAGLASRCTFAGEVEDVPVRLASAHVLLLPSASEGAPLVLAEAQAAGCVAVAHDVGGVSELLAAGDAGVLLPTLDAAAWEDAIRRLLLDPDRRRRLAARGLEGARGRTVARTVARVEAELERVREEAA